MNAQEGDSPSDDRPRPGNLKDTLPYPGNPADAPPEAPASETPAPDAPTVADGPPFGATASAGTASDAPPHEREASPAIAADLGAGEQAKQLGRQVARHARPWWNQTWLNLQVWIPALMNPPRKTRMVTYWAREHRDGMTWKIALPRRCWMCGTEAGLMSREYDRQARSFEAPLGILGAAAAVFLVFLLIAYFFSSWKFFTVALLAVAVGVGVIAVKSWQERVRVLIWTCPDHADELARPDVVLDGNELLLFLPTDRLAELTRADLQDERRGRGAGVTGGSTGGTGEPARRGPAAQGSATAGAAQTPPPSPPPVKRRDLPPIKLAGDEEENA